MVYRIFTLYRANACQLPSWDAFCALTETERNTLVEEIVHCQTPPALPVDWGASDKEQLYFAKVTGRTQPAIGLQDARVDYSVAPTHCLRVYRRQFLDIPVAERSACHPFLLAIIDTYCTYCAERCIRTRTLPELKI